MATPEIPTENRLELMAQASAAYQQRIDDLRREEQKLRLDIASLRAQMRTEILALARSGNDMVVAGYDVMSMSPLDPIDRDSLPPACRTLMEQIAQAYHDLHVIMAKRDAKEACRWQKLAQYLTPEELIEKMTAPSESRGRSASSPAVEEFDRQIDYRLPFRELVEGKPWVSARNGGDYYDIYVRTSSDADRVYFGGPPPGSGEKPPREG